ncbi:MAG: fasciclin domain-containing protein [Tatlockia sp.]|uniref:fasciclin domain-containing protein n=1 Tax=Chlorogloea sp. CCALA 695 TaxID=2107693 RepID=UPI000D085665|nr:fasciclin domain-containing protein [Chlorogloea sp. CCALA 695]MBA2747442.1 fasciclin domain-containing protein [Tatlockia sp.]PSB32836.1 fasciclin [Chlorogloea sp. CCALA 695]
MADIIATAVNAGNFTTLVKAIESADLVDLLKSEGSYTVFAPTDEAFSKLPQEALAALLQDIPKLKRILTYHVVFGDVRAEDLQQIEEAATVEGSIVAIENNNGIKVNDANVLQTDIIADNGVIHIIDGVLIPALVAAE